MLSLFFLFLFFGAVASIFFFAGKIAFGDGRFVVRRSMPLDRFMGECLSWFGMAKHTLGIIFVFIGVLSALLFAVELGVSFRALAFLSTCLLMFHLSENIFWSFSHSRVISFFFSFIVSGGWFFFPYWLTTGIAGYFLSVFILVHLKEISMKQALVASLAIMVYDVSMVFFSGFMVEAAEGAGSTPIGVSIPPALSFIGISMIGLGDIILPGILIMSAFREAKLRGLPLLPSGAIAGYFLGFFFAVFMSKLFGSQPATLYLIPGVCFGFWVTLSAYRVPLREILK